MNPLSWHFRDRMRLYNSMFADVLLSLSASLRMQGRLYHRISTLMPQLGEQHN